MPRFIVVPDFKAFPDLPTHQLTHAAKEFSTILESIVEELSSRALSEQLSIQTLTPHDDDRGYESPQYDDDQYDDENCNQNPIPPSSFNYNDPDQYDDENRNQSPVPLDTYNPPQYDDPDQYDDENCNQSPTYNPPTDFNYDEQYNSPTPPRQYDDDYYTQPDTYNPECRSDDNPHYDY